MNTPECKCPRCGGRTNLEFWQNRDDGLNMGHCHDCGFEDDGVAFEVAEQQKEASR